MAGKAGERSRREYKEEVAKKQQDTAGRSKMPQ
jgi:hypothetical protein